MTDKRYIALDQEIKVSLYDDEREEYVDCTMTVEEYLLLGCAEYHVEVKHE